MRRFECEGITVRFVWDQDRFVRYEIDASEVDKNTHISFKHCKILDEEKRDATN